MMFLRWPTVSRMLREDVTRGMSCIRKCNGSSLSRVVRNGSSTTCIVNGIVRPIVNGIDGSDRTHHQKEHQSVVQGHESAGGHHAMLTAENPDVAVDLAILRPGDVLEIPYELTITDTFADLWHSAFLSQDRLQTSTPYARKLGFQDRVLPFGLMSFLCSSMTHADAAKMQVGYGNIVYHWPGFVGDTFTKTFTVKSVRATSDNKHSIIQFDCNLWNQRGRLCMNSDKLLLFEAKLVSSSPPELDESSNDQMLSLRKHLLSKARMLQGDSNSLVSLRQGQLLRHTHARSLAIGTCQQLASLARLTHPRHFHRIKKNQLLVPGGLVVGLCQSATARELHEVLYEQVEAVQFCNQVHPETTVLGALSLIRKIEAVGGDLQWVTVRTIGINVASQELPHKVPAGLLQTEKLYLPKELEEYCRQNCPELCGRVVVQMDRQILRQATSKPNDVFLL